MSDASRAGAAEKRDTRKLGKSGEGAVLFGCVLVGTPVRVVAPRFGVDVGARLLFVEDLGEAIAVEYPVSYPLAVCVVVRLPFFWVGLLGALLDVGVRGDAPVAAHDVAPLAFRGRRGGFAVGDHGVGFIMPQEVGDFHLLCHVVSLLSVKEGGRRLRGDLLVEVVQECRRPPVGLLGELPEDVIGLRVVREIGVYLEDVPVRDLAPLRVRCGFVAARLAAGTRRGEDGVLAGHKVRVVWLIERHACLFDGCVEFSVLRVAPHGSVGHQFSPDEVEVRRLRAVFNDRFRADYAEKVPTALGTGRPVGLRGVRLSADVECAVRHEDGFVGVNLPHARLPRSGAADRSDFEENGIRQVAGLGFACSQDVRLCAAHVLGRDACASEREDCLVAGDDRLPQFVVLFRSLRLLEGAEVVKRWCVCHCVFPPLLNVGTVERVAVDFGVAVRCLDDDPHADRPACRCFGVVGEDVLQAVVRGFPRRVRIVGVVAHLEGHVSVGGVVPHGDEDFLCFRVGVDGLHLELDFCDRSREGDSPGRGIADGVAHHDFHGVGSAGQRGELCVGHRPRVCLLADGILDNVDGHVVDFLLDRELVGGVLVVDRERCGGRRGDGAEVDIASADGRVYVVDYDAALARGVAALAAVAVDRFHPVLDGVHRRRDVVGVG